MKRKLLLCLSMILVALTVGCAVCVRPTSVRAQSDVRYVCVEGEARLHVAPDTAYVSFCVGSVAKDAATAEQELARIEDAVRAAIKRLDAGAEKSLTEDCHCAMPIARRVDGVCLTRAYRLRTAPSKVDALTRALRQAGAEEHIAVTYCLTDTADAYASAMQAAVENATKKASAWQNLTVVRIRERGTHQYVSPHADGLITVEARVSVCFAAKNDAEDVKRGSVLPKN